MEDPRDWPLLASIGETKSQEKATSTRRRRSGRSCNVIITVYYTYLIRIYLLGDAFEYPPDAQSVGVLAAAFSITRAAILFCFLRKPGVNEQRVSGARDSRKISLIENLPVVQFVPRSDISQGPHAHLVLVRRPSP
jgi:hypothetical protein